MNCSMKPPAIGKPRTLLTVLPLTIESVPPAAGAGAPLAAGAGEVFVPPLEQAASENTITTASSRESHFAVFFMIILLVKIKML